MAEEKARISEIFSSIQGEGLYVGKRQIFLRFSGCNLACSYCDTSYNQDPNYGNMLSESGVIAKIKALDFPYELHDHISFTGGEPLLHYRFIKAVIPKLRALGLKIYLETNSTLIKELKYIIDDIDVIAADFKVEEYTNIDTWPLHREFFGVLKNSGKEFFIKIVINKSFDRVFFKEILDKISLISIDCPIILQPMEIGGKISYDYTYILELEQVAREYFKEVLVIPQIHKILNFR